MAILVLNPGGNTPATPTETLMWNDFVIEDVNETFELPVEVEEIAFVAIGGATFFMEDDVAVNGSEVTVAPELLTPGQTIRIFYKSVIKSMGHTHQEEEGGNVKIPGGGVKPIPGLPTP